MKIGIFGGTFNPIHNGHLRISETARSKFKLDKIYFVPSANPPHKDLILADKNHRYQMTTIAIQNNPNFFISPFEMDSKNKYSYQTIEHFLKQKNQDDEIFFIIGMDSLNNIHKWVKGYELLTLCKFIVISRPNQKLLQNEHLQKFSKNLLFINDLEIGISSTIIREKIKNNLSIKYLVPNLIENYIRKNGLYSSI
jgi:nicotinate-nucleotide adenylyltransferase